MRVNVAIPESNVNEPVLDAALEAVTRLNEQLVKSGDATTFKQALPHVRWKPEPPGAEHFDHAAIVSARGWGDCDDLAPWHAASLRVTGEDRGARAIVVPSGPQRWHAVVQRSDGKIEDPSRAAGMGSNHSIAGAALPLMCAPGAGVDGAYILRPQLALKPSPNGWHARADLPWNWELAPDAKPSDAQYSMAALHQAPIASTALVGAIDGAIRLGEICGAADEDHLERLRCCSDYAAGMPLHELAHEYGHEHARAAHAVVGSFWSHIKKLASPIAHAVTAPITSAAHFVQHPSLSNLTHMVTDPARAALHAAHPLAHALHPFTPFMRFVPGIGPMAASAVDVVDHGLPTSFSDFARMAAQQGAGFIPGVGPALASPYGQMAQQFFPGAASPFTFA